MKKLAAIAGKAGSGKDTILSQLFLTCPNLFFKKISYTTRKPRPGEIDGVHYHFKTDSEFFNLVSSNEIYEATDFQGFMYGTGVDSLKDDKINIGIFDPVGLDILLNEREIDMIPFYIHTDDKLRLIRILQDNRNQTIDEIYERYKFDRELFEDIEYFPNVRIVENNITSIENSVKLIKDIIIKYFKIWHFKKNIV